MCTIKSDLIKSQLFYDFSKFLGRQTLKFDTKDTLCQFKLNVDIETTLKDHKKKISDEVAAANLFKFSQEKSKIEEEITAKTAAEIADLKNQVQNLNNKIESINDSKDFQINQLNSLIGGQKRNIDEQNKVIEDLRSSVNNLTDQVSLRDDLLAKCQAALNQSTLDHQNTKMEKTNVEIQLERTSAQYEDAKRSLDDLNAQHIKVNENIRLMRDTLDQAQNENKKLEDQINSQFEEIKDDHYWSDEFKVLFKPHLESILKTVTGSEVPLNSMSNFTFSMNNLSHIKVITVASYVQLPDVNGISISAIHCDQVGLLKRFLRNSFPNSVNSFTLNNYWDGNHAKLDSYLEELKICIPKVKTELLIYYCQLTSRTLSEIVKLAKHIPKLVFNSCKIDFNDVDFGQNLYYQIQHIGFENCGVKDFGKDWASNPSDINAIINGFSMSGLHTCLNTIDFTNCGIPFGKLKKMLDNVPDRKYTNVKIPGYVAEEIIDMIDIFSLLDDY